MRYRGLIKLVLLISAFSVLAVSYGTRLLLYLETGRGLHDVTCDQKTDEQMAASEDGKAEPPDDQKACWSTLTDIRPQILTDTSPDSVTNTPSKVVTDRSSGGFSDTPSGAVADTPSASLP